MVAETSVSGPTWRAFMQDSVSKLLTGSWTTAPQGHVAEGAVEGPEVPNVVPAGVLKALGTVAAEVEKSVAQAALASLLAWPSVIGTCSRDDSSTR